MQDQKKLPSPTERFTDVLRGGAQGALKDEASQALRAQGAQAGNAAMTQQTAEANVRRDAMLQFVAQRLAQAKVLQARELDQIARNRTWFDEVAKGKQGFKLPDPTRWRNCATLYQRTIEALCAGQMGRAAQLLDQAVEAEKAVYHSLPTQVRRDDFQQAPLGAPDARLGVDYDMVSDPTHAHEMLAVAREIVNVTASAGPAAYPQRNRPHAGWWARAEEPAKQEAPKAAAKATAVEEVAKANAPEAKAKQAAEREEEPVKAPAKEAAKDAAKDAGKAAVLATADKAEAPEEQVAAAKKPAAKEPAGKDADAKVAAPAAAATKPPAKAAEDAAKAAQKAPPAAKAAQRAAAEDVKKEEEQQSRKAQQELEDKLTAPLKGAAAKAAPTPAKAAPKGPGKKS